MTTLLIIGGTGLVGSSIIRETQKNIHLPSYHNTHILALSRTANAKKSVPGVSFVQGDALDVASLKRSFEANPNVVHTVGTLIEQRKYGDNGTYERMNRDAAINVAHTMASKYDGINRRCFIYFSAGNAPPKYLLNERYIGAKREAERYLLGNKELNEKIRIVVLRPGLIYSYHRRQLMLPLALGLIIGSAILKPLTSYVPSSARYFTDRPISDSEVSHAVFEILDDTEVEGICEIDKIRQLAKAWERKKSL
ncbi:uncharacterized protein EV154DRAFT_500680 [Mucor mucedo]|nr:uncharacterized protein EV154DRAFT_500680 [Mucor mucedo]KAI7893754.1 hypothetical protein EV154DRAFT_500680 [Mucor mucedo]